MIIYENSIIELLDIDLKTESILRVLWISPNQEDTIVIDISNDKNMKFPYYIKYEELRNEVIQGKARMVEIDPDLRVISPDADYLEKFKAQREANWNVIKNIVMKEPEIYVSKTRGSLIKQTVENTGKSKKEIYRLLKRYWFYGKNKNGLLRNYFDCGAPRRERIYVKKPGPKAKDKNSYVITDKDKIIFRKAIKSFHVEQKMNLTATHQHMCEESYNSGYYREHGVMVPIVEPEKIPTLRQFVYWYNKEYSLSEKYSRRHGKRKAEMDVRPFMGDATERALGVGSFYEIDSTPADIILVAEDRESIIGPPTLYIVKDVFSRMVVGFHVCLSHASSLEQMVALENAATNKVEFCRHYGIEIDESDWPCKNLPKYLVGDRGELKSKLSENLVNINVDVFNAPSYRGDLKPFVEQQFRITNDKIRELLSKAGAKPGRPKERGDSDPTRNAALTIYEFTQFMILQIITYNKSSLSKKFFVSREMFEDKVELSPLGVWNWGERKKLLHEVPRGVLRYNLLPKENATVTRWGIEFKKILLYTNEIGLKDGWFEEGAIEGQKKIEIRYDPRNVSSFFIRLKNGEIIQCHLTGKSKEYEGLHIEDVKAIQKYKKGEMDKKEKEEKQHQAVLHAFTKKLAKGAIKKTKVATKDMSLYERQKGKKETKKTESRIHGSQNAWSVTNFDQLDNNQNKAEVIFFSEESQSMSKVDSNDIQKKFSSKNKEGRRNRESLE